MQPYRNTKIRYNYKNHSYKELQGWEDFNTFGKKKLDKNLKKLLKISQEVIMNKQNISKYLTELMAKVPCKKSPISSKRKDMEILRTAIIAEYDAVNLYEQMSEAVTDKNIKKVLLDVANEEKVHIGEFEALLERIDIEHEPNEDKGEKEVEKEIL